MVEERNPATPRAYWLGAISSWGIDLVKRGYSVATLTTAYGITYGNTGNPYDLANYDVFVVDEPNKRFTAAESTAIFNFVREGGGLIAVSDHNISDRDNDGFDSPRIWNLLDASHFLGAHFDTTGEANNNFSQNSGNIETSLTDSIIHGPNGVADSISFVPTEPTIQDFNGHGTWTISAVGAPTPSTATGAWCGSETALRPTTDPRHRATAASSMAGARPAAVTACCSRTPRSGPRAARTWTPRPASRRSRRTDPRPGKQARLMPSRGAPPTTWE